MRRVLVVVCVAVLLAACARQSAPGLSTYSPGLFGQGGMQARFEGVLTVTGGCVGLTMGTDFAPIVVPDTTYRWDGSVLDHGNDRVSPGGKLVVGGGLVDGAKVTPTRWGQGCQDHPNVIFVSPDS